MRERRHTMTGRRRILYGRMTLALALAGLAFGAAAEEANPVLHFNQAYVEEAMRTSTLDVKDPMAVFAYVFAGLPERVKVYPTENYFYFTFIHNGAPFDGNIRLDASNRDDGKVIFAYSEDLVEWRGETDVKHLILDEASGVKLEKVEALVYRMTYQDKSVVFELNDLSGVRPPANALAPNETFIGPVFDELGIRFFLVFDRKLKIFHFILDETVRVADQLEPAGRTDRILIGKRTGFAFYRDHLRDRKIMIGGYEGNMVTNSYFDGPFDQLPDNFIEGDTLRDAIIMAEPEMKGQHRPLRRLGRRRPALRDRPLCRAIARSTISPCSTAARPHGRRTRARTTCASRSTTTARTGRTCAGSPRSSRGARPGRARDIEPGDARSGAPRSACSRRPRSRSSPPRRRSRRRCIRSTRSTPTSSRRSAPCSSAAGVSRPTRTSPGSRCRSRTSGWCRRSSRAPSFPAAPRSTRSTTRSARRSPWWST